MKRLLKLAWYYSPGAIIARRLYESPVGFDDLIHARLVVGYEIDILTGEVADG